MKRSRKTGAFTLVELLVVIGIIALLISILLPSLNKARETANRVKCAANLRSIGQTMLLYENDNHGSYPRTVYVGGSTPTINTDSLSEANSPSSNMFIPGNLPSAANAVNNVPMSLFLLLVNEDVTSGIFVCPSSNATPDNYGGGTNTALNRACFSSDVNNLSYSYACPFPTSAALAGGFKLNAGIDPTFAVAADINPGNTPAATNDCTVYPGGAGAKSNSNNHNKAGQNVLYADGHVEFQQSVNVGYQTDNIYTSCNTATVGYQQPGITVGPGQGTFAPTSADDSVLLPTDGNP
jgi:prepilin-type processing-associated H-X9-DG protein